MACSMCELGLKGAERNGVVRDPHVLSNMNPERIIVIGQGPGWDELEKREPFIGAAGKNFDNELAENGLDRSQFYINNAIRCYIKDNGKPTELHIARCRPFLEIEINLIKPIFIVTLGAVAFQVLCPTTAYSDGLGCFTNSIFGIKVFAIYHPSPLNMADQHRKLAFKSQIKALCTLIKTPNIRAKLGGGDEGKI